jgi:hypothetical protein
MSYDDDKIEEIKKQLIAEGWQPPLEKFTSREVATPRESSDWDYETLSELRNAPGSVQLLGVILIVLGLVLYRIFIGSPDVTVVLTLIFIAYVLYIWSDIDRERGEVP